MTGWVMLFLSGATIPPGVRQKLAATHPAIFISNHTSYIDIYLGIWAAPNGTLATGKRETALIPFIGQLYALSGNALINRSNKRDAALALRGIISLMQRLRTSVWIWPEGTRSFDGRLLPLGAASLTSRSPPACPSFRSSSATPIAAGPAAAPTPDPPPWTSVSSRRFRRPTGPSNLSIGTSPNCTHSLPRTCRTIKNPVHL